MLRRYESLTEAEDVAEIEAFLRRDPGVHVYELGDLDPFFRARTRWFGWYRHGLEALCLLYSGSTPPTLVALCSAAQVAAMIELLAALDDQLPAKVYGHVSPHLVSCFAA